MTFEVDLLKDQGITGLNLSMRGLTELLPKIGMLKKLEWLDLSDNKLRVLPPEIGQLLNLKSLYVGRNRLRTLPPEIGQLLNLQELYLWNNELKEIPPEIGLLTNLQIIDLGLNYLTALPRGIGHLLSLHKLFLGDNQLRALPTEIGQLINLRILDLQHNQLSVLPQEISRLKNLQELDLRGNPGNPLPIPPEILEKTDNPESIITWYLTNVLTKAAKRPLNEAKMILVGQGAVGKTSLVKKLIDDEFDPLQDMTKGIEIRRWKTGSEGGEIKLNVWDFGGQEILHSTHQFFLTKRSLYLLVLDSRLDEQANRLEYWLKIIQAFGDGAPIVVVCNKCDQQEMALDWSGLQVKYPQIKAFVRRLSCATGEGIKKLVDLITGEVAKLEHVTDILAENWFAVKNRMAAMSEEKVDYLPYKEYEKICGELGIKETSSHKILMGYLHDLGIALHYAAQNSDRYFPQEADFVLNPEWVTSGVYEILNSNKLFQNNGVLHIKDLEHILEVNRYPADKHSFIINMMRYFELLFDFPEKPQELFLVPDLLAKEGPDTGRWEDSLAFQYYYDVLPGSVISRFIVRMKTHISEKTYWRTGVVLKTKDGNNRALVKADLEDKRMAIFIDGDQPNRRRFLTSIRHCFEEIHDTIPRLRIEEKVPVPGHPKVLLDYERLLKMEARGIEMEYVEEIDELVNIKEILEGIETKEERRKRDILTPRRLPEMPKVDMHVYAMPGAQVNYQLGSRLRLRLT